MEKFIMLRDANRPLRDSGAFTLPHTTRPGTLTTAETAVVPPEPHIEVAEMTAAEAQDATRDPGIVAISRAMPTRLITPRDDAPPAAVVPAWGVAAVGADTSPFDGAGVRVCVLDTGIDATHPAFAGVTLIQNDFSVPGGGPATDGHGHGTHCAGTIFGRDVDGTRIGIARGVTEALIGKVLGDDGSGSSEMLFDAMQWASSNNARVISMSLGFDFPGLVDQLVNTNGMPIILATSVALEAYRMNLRVFDALMDMIRARADFNGGIVVVAASGNESERQIDPDFEVSASLPAAANGVISVGALKQDAAGLKIADFSNTNPVLSAPGVGIVSAKKGGGLVAMNGTSMACPHVAGVTALWWQAVAAAALPQGHRTIEARLFTTARGDVFMPGTQVPDRGQGLVQAPTAAIA